MSNKENKVPSTPTTPTVTTGSPNRWIKVMLCVSLCMIIFGSALSGLFLCDFGNVVVTSVTFPMEEGQYLAADLYRPTTATADSMHTSTSYVYTIVPDILSVQLTQSQC